MNIDPNGLPEPYKSRILTFRETLEYNKLITPNAIKTYKYSCKVKLMNQSLDNTEYCLLYIYLIAKL